MIVTIQRRTDGPVYAGGIIEGFVNIYNPSPSNVKRITLQVCLKEKSQVTRQETEGVGDNRTTVSNTYNDHVDHIKLSYLLYSRSGNRKLEAGQYYIPFAIRLPGSGLPFTFMRCGNQFEQPRIRSSIWENSLKHGVEFTITAVVSTGWTSLSDTIYPVLHCPVQIPLQPQPIVEEEETTVGCCRQAGIVRVLLHADKSHVNVANDELLLNLDIDNNSNRLLPIRLFVTRRTAETARGRTDHFTQSLSELKYAEQPPWTSHKHKIRMPLGDLQVPTTQHTRLFKVSYLLQVKVGKGWCPPVSLSSNIVVGNSKIPEVAAPVYTELLSPLVLPTARVTNDAFKVFCSSCPPQWQTNAQVTVLPPQQTGAEQLTQQPYTSSAHVAENDLDGLVPPKPRLPPVGQQDTFEENSVPPTLHNEHEGGKLQTGAIDALQNPYLKNATHGSVDTSNQPLIDWSDLVFQDDDVELGDNEGVYGEDSR